MKQSKINCSLIRQPEKHVVLHQTSDPPWKLSNNFLWTSLFQFSKKLKKASQTNYLIGKTMEDGFPPRHV